VVTVVGAGDDIYVTEDAFHYRYQSVSGDATITARVTSLQAVYIWSKAAVMMRDGRAPDARNVVALTSPTLANGYRLQARTSTGAITSTEKSTNGTTPIWLRLTRRGNDFTGFTSSNGTAWTQLGLTKTIAMPATILVGLAVTSHDITQTTTATFDNVSLTTP
jgi:regulation of enolase protein 1 (concanavalin A-like superfamily)